MAVPQFMIIPPLLITAISPDARQHLLHLKLDHWMIGGTVSVILGQDLGRLLVLVLRYQPAGAFWNEKDTKADKT